MNAFNTVVLEMLESRTLYSTTPSPTITADLAAIQTDKDQINVDKSLGDETSLTDQRQVAQDRFTKLGQVSTLRLKLASDTEADGNALLTDQITALSKRLADRTVITHDYMNILADRGNSAQELLDASQLTTDQSTLAADISGAVTIYKSDQATFKVQLLNDRLNILKVKVDDDSTVLSDKLKVLTDKLATATTLLGDQKKLTEDEIKLAQDKAAGK